MNLEDPLYKKIENEGDNNTQDESQESNEPLKRTDTPSLEKDEEPSTVEVDDFDEDDEFDRDVEEEEDLNKEITKIEISNEEPSGSSLDDDDENMMENVDENTGDTSENNKIM